MPGTQAIADRKTRRGPLDLESSPAWANTPRLTYGACTAAFDRATPGTVGVEEELMLISPETLDLAPANEEVLGWLGGEPEFQRELRASQIEIVTPVCRNAAEIEAALTAGRDRLLQALAGRVAVIAAAAHPFATDFGELSDNDRYRIIEGEYRWAARRSVLCGLHVHVSVGGAGRTLAVYNSVLARRRDRCAPGFARSGCLTRSRCGYPLSSCGVWAPAEWTFRS